VIESTVLSVSATRVEVTDGLHVPLTTTSNPFAALATSAAVTPLIVSVAVAVPAYVDPLPVGPSAMFTPFFRHW
jgi:hypothetical protein